MLLRIRCLLVGHIWCWDPHHRDTFERGGPIVTCARCGARDTGYWWKTLFLDHNDVAWLSREEAEEMR